jgi:glycosyltransferase involved in cell wall biosynthesis
MLGGLSPRAMMRYEIFRQRFDFWALLMPTWLARRSFMQEILQQTWGIRPPADIIHLHEPSWLGGFAVWMAQPWKIPVLCQEATNPALPILGYDVPRRRDIGRWRKEAHFIAMAQYLADDLRTKGIPTERIHLLPNGVQIPDTAATPEKNGHVLYVGNFSQGARWKAFDILFEAWSLVHKHNPKAHLVVLGGGDSSLWKKFVDKKGCASSVEFKGRVANPSQYFQRASMLVLPSRVEGMSNALLEAQSWGLPCIVSEIPGNREVVRDDINGLVVPVNDSEAFSAAILRLLNNTEDRRRLGLAARAIAKQKFDINQVLDDLIHLYKRLAPNFKKSP